VGLSQIVRAEKHQILSVLQEAHGSQLIDLALVDGGLEGEVKVILGLLNRETGHLDLILIGTFPLDLGRGCGHNLGLIMPQDQDYVCIRTDS